MGTLLKPFGTKIAWSLPAVKTFSYFFHNVLSLADEIPP
jgi:hypothetical protein